MQPQVCKIFYMCPLASPQHIFDTVDSRGETLLPVQAAHAFKKGVETAFSALRPGAAESFSTPVKLRNGLANVVWMTLVDTGERVKLTGDRAVIGVGGFDARAPREVDAIALAINKGILSVTSALTLSARRTNRVASRRSSKFPYSGSIQEARAALTTVECARNRSRLAHKAQESRALRPPMPSSRSLTTITSYGDLEDGALAPIRSNVTHYEADDDALT